VTARPLVPADFDVPAGHECAGYRLEPLGPEHNASDYAAWTSSVDHIRSLPGFPDGTWPDPSMTAADNLGDLQRHRRDFHDRRGFTYTVLDDSGAVAGCLYIYPNRKTGTDAEVSSWLRADHAERETEFRAAVQRWIAEDWPFRTWTYSGQRHGRAAEG
jgi:hypothetical protein